MRLGSPWLLALAALLPLVWPWRRGAARTAALRFPTLAGLRAVAPAGAARRRIVLAVLRLVALVLLAVAFARPQAGTAATKVHREGVDVVLAVDVSGSMLSEDFTLGSGRASRLDAVKAVVKEFVAARAEDRIGLVLFGARPYTQCPLTLDHGWLLQNLERAKVGMIEDGTAIGSGLATAVNRLRASTAKSKFVVLLTDGQQNAGRITPETAAEAAAALGIKVYTVGAGTRGLAPFPMQDIARRGRARRDGAAQAPMILWRDPTSLVALLLVPALAAFFLWARRRRERALAAFVAAALLPAVAPDVDRRRRTARAVLVCGAILCLALALGGPMWGFRWQEVHREGIDLVVALDTSRSMLATDVKPNRLGRAKLAVEDLLAQLRGDRAGLVAFAGSAFVQCPLTLDQGAFRESVDSIDVGIIPRGGTNLGAAIDASLEAFEGRQGNHQALVLITDGESHEGDVKEATKRAQERGVKVYTVGIGTTEGELVPAETGGYVKDRKGQVVKSRLDEETLRQIASDTGGVYLHAE
ncbi:MAG: VWA domain-containing protein, partial [Deltaproteobacteria bacterium]